MNKEVFQITHEIMQKLMDHKSCKVAQVSIEPDGDPIMSIKSFVTIKFAYYDREEDVDKPKERIRTGTNF